MSAFSKKSNKNKILLIVESPAKCSTIVGHLGADKYVCVATFGHMRELAGLADIDTTFTDVPQFHVVESKKAQIDKIRALVAECKETYLMTDNDREGAGIAYHVCCLFGLPIATTRRIVFNEITKPALERAIQSPQLLNMDAVYAQIARQALDMLVGFKITPTLWNHVSVPKGASSLSAGRCQTPALRLIYDNQCDIDAVGEGTVIYNTVGYFTKLNLKYDLSKGHDTADGCAAFLRASAVFEHVIRAPKMHGFSKPAPRPLTTSALQQQASNELSLSPAETMLACQHLYEGGYITYPRTDSRVYSEPFLAHARDYITEKWGEQYVKSATQEDAAKREDVVVKNKRIVVKKKRDTPKEADKDDADKNDADKEAVEALEDVKPQEAHEAVHATSLHCVDVPDTMTAKEQRLYRMIWRHSVETCMAPCTGSTMTSCISAPEDRDYRHSVERIEFAGWRIVAMQMQSKSDAAADATNRWMLLQAIVPDSTIKYNKLQSAMQVRELKSHYSEASLVSMLEERGIGRPSTFSSLVHKIQERGYVAKQDVPGRRVSCTQFELVGGVLSQTAEEREFGNEKNRLVLQPLGRAVITFLFSHFAELFDYDYTKRMEHQLDLVSSGKKRWDEVCKECVSCVDRLIDGLNAKCLTKTKTTSKGTNESNESNETNETIALSEQTTTTTERKSEKNLCKLLGKYKGVDLFLRTGRYGPYLTWGDNKKSLTHLKSKGQSDTTFVNVDVDTIPCSYDDAVRHIESSASTDASTTSTATSNSAILREINTFTSVRTGQYGPYIYYKNPKMTTPAFVSLRGFKEDWKTCDLRILEMWSTTTPVKKK
jgi:DNA topoisomerase-1